MTKEKLWTNPSAATQMVHKGRNKDPHGFVNPALIRASTVLYPDAQTLRDDKNLKYTYGLNGTPTIDALCEAINTLEESEGTVLLPSGLAACTLPLLTFLKPGDQLLMPDNVYWPTKRFCNSNLKNFGVTTTYYDPLKAEEIDKLFTSSLKVIFVEAPGSGTFEIPNLQALIQKGKEAGALLMIDNTWATPLIYQPLKEGFDLSIQAGTKYYAGHSDALIGSVSSNKKHWKRLYHSHKNMGLQAGTEEIYLTLRGLRTLPLRLAHHEKSALIIAKWLEAHPLIERVLHPALPSSQGHEFWKHDFKQRSSGLFAFTLNGTNEQADDFLNKLKYFGMGYSWGGFESLAITVKIDMRTQGDIPQKPLIRLSIGLEETQDLIKDLAQGLDSLGF